MAIRYRWSCQVLYARYGEFYDLQRLKDAVAQQRGWTQATYWIALAGNLNDFFLEREYETLQDFAREQEEREGDHEFMKLMRDSYKLCVQGSIRIEMFRAAEAP